LVACSTEALPEAQAPRAARAPTLESKPPPLAERSSDSANHDVSAPAAAPSASQSEEEALTREIPTTCSGTDGCYPDPAFTERLCRGKFPDLPLAFFAKAAPWEHRFVQAVTLEPVNMYGGPRSDLWMNFGEEVVVLRKRGPGKGNGVQMSGPTDLDVLRWDGTCATIREEMFVSYNPGQMTSPRIVWKYLDDALQEGLRKSPAVLRAQAHERKSCRDSSPTKPTPACDNAMRKLTEAIVSAVRQGAELPLPDSAPAWRTSAPTASR
jgi:hypothetical protein